jgi:hypothetical protein
VPIQSLSSVIASAAVWPLGTRAERPAMPVIGLFSGPIDMDLIAAFRRGLAEAGCVEGKTSRSNTALPTSDRSYCLRLRAIWFG